MGELHFINLSRAILWKVSSPALSSLSRQVLATILISTLFGCSIFGSSNGTLGDASIFVGRLGWPVRGHQILAKFGKRGWFSQHDGLDIKAKAGEPIFSAQDGFVTYSGSGNGMNGYGNVVIVRSGTLATLYAHNQRNLVHRGQRVERGQHIADVGMTGNASGPHLHFETRIITGQLEFTVVDPMLFYQD